MRGTVAKRIRREVYGDNSLRAKRRYLINPRTGQLIADGLRRTYQAAKKAQRGG